MLSGQVDQPFIKGSQDQSFAHREAEQVGIGDLIVSVDTLGKRSRQRLPVSRYRLIVVTRSLLQSFQHGRPLLHTEISRLWPGEEPQHAGFRKGTERPPQSGRIKPIFSHRMVNVVLVQEGQYYVYVQQVYLVSTQGRLLRAA